MKKVRIYTIRFTYGVGYELVYRGHVLDYEKYFEDIYTTAVAICMSVGASLKIDLHTFPQL